MPSQSTNFFISSDDNMGITSLDTPLGAMRDLSKKLGIPLRMEKNKKKPTHYFALTFDIGKLEITIFSEDFPNDASENHEYV